MCSSDLGDTIGADTVAALREATQTQVAAVEERIANKKADLQLMADAAKQQKREE